MNAAEFLDAFDRASVEGRRGRAHKSIDALKKLRKAVPGLYGEDSFVDAHLLQEMSEQHLLIATTVTKTEGAAAALVHTRTAWELMEKAMAILRKRQQLSAGACEAFSLMPGQPESEFFKDCQVITARDLQPELYAARNDQPHSAIFMIIGSCGAYTSFLRCSYLCLLRFTRERGSNFPFDPFHGPEVKRALDIIVEGLNLMGKLKQPIPVQMAVELRVVSSMQLLLNGHLVLADKAPSEPIFAAFHAAAPLLAQRGILSQGTRETGGKAAGTDARGRRFVAGMSPGVASEYFSHDEKSTARRLEALTLRGGLHECGLPECGKREQSSGHFRVCSGCRSCWYCSAEHAKANWPAHKAECRRIAAEQEEEGAKSAGAAAAAAAAAGAGGGAAAGSSSTAAAGSGSGSSSKKKKGR